MNEAIIIPTLGVILSALAGLIGVAATQRAAKAANSRSAAIDEFRAQVAARDAWIAEMDRRLARCEYALKNERDYVDRLRDWIAAVALPALVRSNDTYPPVPEYREVGNDSR